jgi:hypothetical protein
VRNGLHWNRTAPRAGDDTVVRDEVLLFNCVAFGNDAPNQEYDTYRPGFRWPDNYTIGNPKLQDIFINALIRVGSTVYGYTEKATASCGFIVASEDERVCRKFTCNQTYRLGYEASKLFRVPTDDFNEDEYEPSITESGCSSP